MKKEMITKLPKNHLHRLVSRIKLKKNQPSWKLLCDGKNKLIWESALEKARQGQKVLIATSVGSHLAGTTLESLLSVALTLRGAEVQILLCDEVLPACLACRADLYHDTKAFAKRGPGGDCHTCFYSAHAMFSSLGLKVCRYSEFLSVDDIERSREIAESVPFHEIGDYSNDGIAVGEHALAGALRYFARGDLSGEIYAEPILRRYFKAALITMFLARNLLNANQFDVAVLHHGIYVPQGIIAEVCRKKGLRIVTWNPGYRKRCFIFSHDATYHHTMISEPAEKWTNIPWNDRMETELMDYLKSRWTGEQDWIWFHEKPVFDLNIIGDKFGIDFSKPCVGILTSVMWDAVLHYPSNAFPCMLDWLIQTIDFFVKRPDIQVIIRVHPAEIRGTLPARQRIADEIKRIYPVLPKNIIIVPPECDVSTYAVMLQCNAALIYNTKMGIELAAMGIPVIVAGEAWVRNKGFAIEADNPDDYFRILNLLPFQNGMLKDDISRAKKYAYHFFFRRMIPLESFVPAVGVSPYRIKLRDINDLTKGYSAGLDLICDGILKGSDFIYPAERQV